MSIFQDETSKESLLQGLNSLVKDGNETGVWEVVACASSNWKANANEIETLRGRLNSYEEREKELQNSDIFTDESARLDTNASKRKADDISAATQPNSIWDEFETMIMKGGGNAGSDYTGVPISTGLAVDRLR